MRTPRTKPDIELLEPDKKFDIDNYLDIHIHTVEISMKILEENNILYISFLIANYNDKLNICIVSHKT